MQLTISAYLMQNHPLCRTRRGAGGFASHICRPPAFLVTFDTKSHAWVRACNSPGIDDSIKPILCGRARRPDPTSPLSLASLDSSPIGRAKRDGGIAGRRGRRPLRCGRAKIPPHPSFCLAAKIHLLLHRRRLLIVAPRHLTYYLLPLTYYFASANPSATLTPYLYSTASVAVLRKNTDFLTTGSSNILVAASA